MVEEAHLPQGVLDALRAEALGLTAVVATVATDRRPHTAPFGSVRAVSPTVLRFGCDRDHDTYANLLRDARATVCVLAPPDIAVTVFGRARVVKEEMETLPTDAVIEVAVERVKDDMLPGATIASGATYAVPEDLRGFLRRYRDEVEREP